MGTALRELGGNNVPANLLQRARSAFSAHLVGTALISGLGTATASAECVFPKGGMTVEHAKLTREFKYLEPGVLFPPTSFQDSAGQPKSRKYARYVAVPDLVFPFDMGPAAAKDLTRSRGDGSDRSRQNSHSAIMQSIVGSFGGCGGPNGAGYTDLRNLQHPDRDNFGETRSSDSYNPFVSSGTGHQGCDIRNPTAKRNIDIVRAAEAGTVIQVSASGHIAIQTRGKNEGGSGTTQFYLHIEQARALVSRGQEVQAGQAIGYAGDIIRGQVKGTHPHLHFEIRVSSFVIDGKLQNRSIDIGTSNWGIPLPCYPSLVAAKMRELGLKPNIIGDQLVHDSRYEVSLKQFLIGDNAPTTDGEKSKPDDNLAALPPEGMQYDSYWKIDNADREDAVLGLVSNAAGTREFYLLTKRNTMFKKSGTAQTDELVFRGRIQTDLTTGLASYTGKLTYLDPKEDVSRRCPSMEVDAAGPVLDRPLRVELTAEVPLFDAACNVIKRRTDIFTIAFYGNTPSESEERGSNPTIVDKDRKSIVEATRNWGAITMPKADPATWLIERVDPNDPAYPYIYVAGWPGLRQTGHLIDKFGQTVPAFETDESGVGLWWYWITRRKGFTATGRPTLQQLAKGIAGDDAGPFAVNNYLESYLALAQRYFDGQVPGPDTPIPLSDPDQRFALAWVMFHHEAGREPLIDRSTFDRGIRLGNDLMGKNFGRLCAYLASPCKDGSPLPATAKVGGDEHKPQMSASSDSASPRSSDQLASEVLQLKEESSALQKQIAALRDDKESLQEESRSLLARLRKSQERVAELERRLAQKGQSASLSSKSSQPKPPAPRPRPPQAKGSPTVAGDCGSWGWLSCATETSRP
jgi:murein DD-endopeptidase MepM/ murein hydrolase activator NlpD